MEHSVRGGAMISIEQAARIVHEHTPKPIREELALGLASGRILAEDIYSPVASPACTSSSMDGYAISRAGLSGDCDPQTFSLVCGGESRAGHPYSGAPAPGNCIAISTGAMLPDWCDTVVPVEDTRVVDNTVFFMQPVRRGQFVRNQGSEFLAGELLLKRGERLDPSRIGLLAAVGVAVVAVYRPPKVALIMTGSELVPFNRKAEKQQARDSNALMLEDAIARCGAELSSVVRVEDSFEATVAALQAAQGTSDLVLFSGGISAGEYDYVRRAALSCAFQELFWRVRQKPGKPLFFAEKGDTLLFGLPGNPVSSYMNFILYIYPLLTAIRGREQSLEDSVAVMGHDLVNNGDRTTFYQVSLAGATEEPPIVAVLERQESFMATSLTGGVGFLTVAAGESIAKGSQVTVRLLPWRR